MKRQRPGAEERRVFVMRERYAVLACVGKNKLTEHPLLKR
jgi:hypothetical protein